MPSWGLFVSSSIKLPLNPSWFPVELKWLSYQPEDSYALSSLLVLFENSIGSVKEFA
jgi:hypothetical protein